MPTLLPNRLFTTLRVTQPYVTIADGNMVGGQLSTFTVRGNGAYDPWYAIGGPSPKYFNWYNQVYHSYRVHAAKIIVTFSNNTFRQDGNVLPDLIAGIYISDEVAPYTGVEEVLEEITNKWTNLPVLANWNTDARTGFMPRTLRHAAMSKNLFSVKDIEDASYQSLVNTVPAIQWFFNVYVARQDIGVATPKAVDVRARITVIYKMEFFDRKERDV